MSCMRSRRTWPLASVKRNWIRVALSLAGVQQHFCQVVVKLKINIFGGMEK